MLDRNHAYFYQIQGSMGLSGTKFCNFIVWTPKSFEVITVNFEISFWGTEMLPKLSSFYTTYMLPAILYIKLLTISKVVKHMHVHHNNKLSYKRREKISQHDTYKENLIDSVTHTIGNIM